MKPDRTHFFRHAPRRADLARGAVVWALTSLLCLGCTRNQSSPSRINAESFGGVPSAEERKKELGDWARFSFQLVAKNQHTRFLGEEMRCPGPDRVRARLSELNQASNARRKDFGLDLLRRKIGKLAEQPDRMDIKLSYELWKRNGKEVPARTPLDGSPWMDFNYAHFVSIDAPTTYVHEMLHGVKMEDGTYPPDEKILAHGTNVETYFDDIAAYVYCNTAIEAGEPFDSDRTLNDGEIVELATNVDGFVGNDPIVRQLAELPGGKVLVLARIGNGGEYARTMLYRVLPDGQLDTTWGSRVQPNLEPRTGRMVPYVPGTTMTIPMAMLPLANGKVVVLAASLANGAWEVVLFQIDANGELDTAGFNAPNGYHQRRTWAGDFPYSLTRGKDGKYYVGFNSSGGGIYWPAVARYLENGTVDTTLNNGNGYHYVGYNVSDGFSQIPYAIRQREDRKFVVLTTSVYPFNSAEARYPTVYLLNEDLTPDLTFGTDGGYSRHPVTLGSFHNATSMALMPNGDILLAGTIDSSGYKPILTRLDRNGQLKTDFGSGGSVVLNQVIAANNLGRASALAVQPDGTILLGIYGTEAGAERLLVYAFKDDGRPERRYGVGGRRVLHLSSSSYIGAPITLLPNGRILAGGRSGDTLLGFTRLYGDPQQLLTAP